MNRIVGWFSLFSNGGKLGIGLRRHKFMQHRTETSVEQNGTIVLSGLPFRKGDKVIVIITTRPPTAPRNTRYSLRSLPVEYKNPLDPVAESDWSVLS